MAFRELRINEQIRIPQVRLFDDTTQESFGIVPIDRARQLAVERELDLVEVAPMAQPPVCRLMDYGRFKFEALKREKDSRKEHNLVRLKEMKLRPKISDHDFQTKFGYVKHFLLEGDKVKLTIMFRGREMVHQEYGRKLLDRMAAELKEVAIVERNPLVEGRNMIMILSPLAKKQAKGPHQEGEVRLPAEDHGRAGSAPEGATATATAPASAPPASHPGGGVATARVPVATESAVGAATPRPAGPPPAPPGAEASDPAPSPTGPGAGPPAHPVTRRPPEATPRPTEATDAKDQNA